MNLRRLGALTAVAIACSIANGALAEPAARTAVPAAEHGTIHVSAVTVPPTMSERTRTMLRDAVEQRLSEIAPDMSRGGYSASVALLQLRRYIGPDSNEPRTVCIVDLALHDASGVIVGSVRGRASAVAMTPQEILDAAARSAAARVPDALRMVTEASKARGAYARR
jgi:hypothetical protein